MEEYLVLIVLFIGLALIYFKKNVKTENNRNELLLSLNENLRMEIKEIRKEMSANSEKGRAEIERKLIGS